MAIVRPPAKAASPEPLAPVDVPLRPLCPACGAATVRVTVAAAVAFDVVAATSPSGPCDLQVIAHEWLDGGWDEGAPAACPGCGWQGDVGALACSP